MTRPAPRRWSRALVALGAALSVALIVWYSRGPYRPGMGWLWLASLSALVVGALPSRRPHPVDRAHWLREALIVATLLVLAAGAYLIQIGEIPYQVITDELAIMHYMRQESVMRPMDLFGLSYYFKFPRLIFIAFGLAARAMGGVSLPHVRLLHALCGIAVVVASYAWLRAALRRELAAVGALIIGGNHALVGLSRLAMRDNTAVLFEVAAYAALMRGLQRGDLWLSLVGGMLGGLSFYTYYPSRVTMVLWGLFLLVLLAFGRRVVAPRHMVRAGAAALLGTLAVVGPLAVATVRDSHDGWGFVRDQLLLFPEGRAIQQQWLIAPTEAEGVRRNLINGLTLFTCRDQDRSYSYVNPGHGFLDPLTGTLVWIGLIVLLRRRSLSGAGPWIEQTIVADRFVLMSLTTLWLLFTVIVNKTPNYTRLLVALPFMGYAAVAGLRGVAAELGVWLRRLLRRPLIDLPGQVIGLTLAGILVWNGFIFGDYVTLGHTSQQEYAATGRYVMARKDRPAYRFILVTGPGHQYYWWGIPDYWRYWIDIFANPKHPVEIITPDDALRVHMTGPLTLFMTESLWRTAEPELRRMYPDARVHQLTPSGSHVALEVQ